MFMRDKCLVRLIGDDVDETCLDSVELYIPAFDYDNLNECKVEHIYRGRDQLREFFVVSIHIRRDYYDSPVGINNQ